MAFHRTINNDTGSLRTGDVRLKVGQCVRIGGENWNRVVTYVAGSPGRFHAYFKGQGSVPVGLVEWELVDAPAITSESKAVYSAGVQRGSATVGARRMWLPSNGRAVGIDWSGAANAHQKVWAATLSFEGGKGRLEQIQKPFSSRGAEAVSAALGLWLSVEDFDVAGLDFCFGLEEGLVAALGLPVSGPSDMGKAIRAAFPSAELFKAAVGPEKKRSTDHAHSAPFAPTNLRMYKQTYWGLRALGACRASFPPWKHSDRRRVVEVLPANVVQWLGGRVSYKGRGLDEKRWEILGLVRASTDLDVSNNDILTIVSDAEGDALDALLAALAAASSWASAFAGAPPTAASSGEGWIFSVMERPER